MEMNDTAINLNKKNNVYKIKFPNLEIKYRNKTDRRCNREIYTDGSKIDNKVGSALVAYNYTNKVYHDG